MPEPRAFTTPPALVDVPLPITTPRLLIDRPRQGDGAAMAEAAAESWEQLKPWFRWTGDYPRGFTAEAAEIYVRERRAAHETRSDLAFSGRERKTGRLVLWTGLHKPDWRVRRFEISFWVRRTAMAQGYATEAGNALLRYAFGALAARLVVIWHAEGNERSRRVIAKLGFAPLGVWPFGHELPDGTLVAAHWYARTKLADLPPLAVHWSDAAPPPPAMDLGAAHAKLAGFTPASGTGP